MLRESELLSHGLQHHKAGSLNEAEARYADVLHLAPRHADALHLLGVVAHQRQQHQRAVDLIRDAIQVKDSCAPFHCNLGAAYRSLGQFDEAIDCYLQAIRLNPGWADPHYNLGNAYQAAGRLREACDSYRRAIACDGQHAAAHNNLGDALKQCGQLEEAIACHRQAIAIRPDFPDGWFNLGNALKRTGAVEEAVDAYRRATLLRPTFVDAFINLGYALEEQGRFDDAIAAYDGGIEIDPACVDGRFNRALAMLRLGEFARGWTEYEYRPSRREARCSRIAPDWDGVPHRDGTVLVRGEQGVGDEIMFASCIPDAQANFKQLIFECEPRLVGLFQRSFPNVEVRGRFIENSEHGRAMASFASSRPTHEVFLASLPNFVRPHRDDFPRCASYLVADAQSVAKWRSRFAALGDALKVGISWRGGKDEQVRRMRSTTLDRWAALFAAKDAQFVNLQYGVTADELAQGAHQSHYRFHHWDDSDPLRNLDDFAAQISALDLVISVDNSTVHLAGALGVTTWALLPFAADWRWLVECDDTVWYRDVRLFRQTCAGDWESVFANVKENFDRLIARSAIVVSPHNKELARN